MGLEPMTLRLKVWCSTDWANQATRFFVMYCSHWTPDRKFFIQATWNSLNNYMRELNNGDQVAVVGPLFENNTKQASTASSIKL